MTTPEQALAANKAAWKQKIDAVEQDITGFVSRTELEAEIKRLRAELKERTEERDYTYSALERVKESLRAKQEEYNQIINNQGGPPFGDPPSDKSKKGNPLSSDLPPNNDNQEDNSPAQSSEGEGEGSNQ